MKVLRATIHAKNEEHDLYLSAEIDVREEKVGVGREKIEARLQDFVAKTSLTLGLIYECSPVVWRERGNRNRLR
jgi:hypothetical protein